MLLVVSTVAGGGLAAPLRPTTGAFPVSISSTPSAQDPYLILFNVTVLTGTPTAYAWSFGDGLYSNGTGPGFADPSHRYAGPGAYNVSVVVWEGAQSGSQSLPLVVPLAPLKATIGVSPDRNVSALTETFSVRLVGGSGVYESVLWTFGDGGTGSGFSLQYTYARPGSYTATVNVTDSHGSSTTARAVVTVSGPAPRTTPAGIPSSEVLAALAIALGAGTGASVLVTRLIARRSARRDSLLHDVAASPNAAPPVPEEAGAPFGATPPSGPGELPRPIGSPGGTEEVPGRNAPPSESAGPTPTAPVVRATPAALRLSERIVVHVGSLGRIGADDVATVGFTQQGMVEALEVRQNTLTHVLRRLVAAGILEESVGHVRGQARRLKVYRLTTRGEGLARELRHHVEDRSASDDDRPNGPPPRDR